MTPPARPLVLIESPFKGELERNLRYARVAMRHAFFEHGEYPFASHLLYPGILDDNDPIERALGIEAGLAWGACAKRTVVYTDLGLSDGMRLGIERARSLGRPVELRRIPYWWRP